jgi:leucyl-tRNA synthetase
MPQWAGSCWYYLRYLDAQNNHRFVGDEEERYWMGSASEDATPGVDLYVGGTEHAVLHLLYARFWHKVLFDLGQVTTPEPFYKLVNQGLILGEDGQKMSKSRGNAVNPDDILVEFGSDAFRLYEMFMGPLEMVKPWNTKGVEGVYRFLGRVWRMFIDEQSEQEFEQQLTMNPDRGPELLAGLKLNGAVGQAEATPEQLKVLHTCIKKVTEDMEHLRFNTAISAMMVFTNEASNWDIRPLSVMNDFLLLLAPFAPHIAEELHAKANGRDSTLAYQPWPSHDEAHLVESTIEMAVQVNGKLRDRIQIPADMDKSDIERIAMESENVQRHTEGKNVKKVIVIPGKLVNIVAL